MQWLREHHGVATWPMSWYEVLEAQRLFLEEHLLQWVPEFADRLYQSAESDFFKGMAIVLRELIGEHSQYLSEAA